MCIDITNRRRIYQGSEVGVVCTRIAVPLVSVPRNFWHQVPEVTTGRTKNMVFAVVVMKTSFHFREVDWDEVNPQREGFFTGDVVCCPGEIMLDQKSDLFAEVCIIWFKITRVPKAIVFMPAIICMSVVAQGRFLLGYSFNSNGANS